MFNGLGIIGLASRLLRGERRSGSGSGIGAIAGGSAKESPAVAEAYSGNSEATADQCICQR